MRNLMTGLIFMTLTQAAGAAITQNPITLIARDLEPNSRMVSDDIGPAALLQKTVTSEAPTVHFECHNSKTKIEIKAYSFLVRSCSDALFNRLPDDKDRSDKCEVLGDQKYAKVLTAYRVSNAQGKILAEQKFAGVQKETFYNGSQYYSYSYGKDYQAFYPDTNTARRTDPKGNPIQLGFAWQIATNKGSEDIFMKNYPLHQDYPALAKLKVFVNEEPNYFSGLNKYSCKHSDENKTAKRFEIDLNSATAQVTSNKFALNPSMTELEEGKGPFIAPKTFAYGWGKKVWLGNDIAVKTCYEVPHLEQHDVDLDETVSLEPMTCTSML